jgi:hypothetical protein
MLCVLLPLATGGGCGGEDEQCPAGTVRLAGRCVAGGAGADAGRDAAPDCAGGEGVGGDCQGDEGCPCGPCATLADGRRACASLCDEGQTCLAGWECGAGGICGCAAAEETCNLRDDDCDGAIDDDASDAPEWFPDEDGDGFGDSSAAVAACEPPEGAIATGGDCDDASAERYPAAPEICDGLDDDCDEAVPSDEADVDEDGAFVCEGDCADDDATRYPGAAEACNGIDDDCDASVPADEADGDGDTVRICGGDCADEDGARHPGAAEVCDDVDDDCDGGLPPDEVDVDGDGYALCEGDCADDDETRYPGAPELCNGIDDDCTDGVPANETDGDGDVFRICDGDCADDEATRYPGAPELCNGIDDDCANGVPAAEADADGDDVMVCEGDCLDSNEIVFPGQGIYLPFDRGDGSFDYNCDGLESRRYPRGGCSPNPFTGECFNQHWCDEVPDCGQSSRLALGCTNCLMICVLDEEVQTCR